MPGQRMIKGVRSEPSIAPAHELEFGEQQPKRDKEEAKNDEHDSAPVRLTMCEPALLSRRKLLRSRPRSKAGSALRCDHDSDPIAAPEKLPFGPIAMGREVGLGRSIFALQAFCKIEVNPNRKSGALLKLWCVRCPTTVATPTTLGMGEKENETSKTCFAGWTF